MKNQRKLIVYIAMSLDGFIATQDDNLDFLSVVEKEGEDYGYVDFVNTVDTVIIGRKTYDKVLSMGIEFPHQDKTVYVITTKTKPKKGSCEFYTGDLSALVDELKSKKGKNIYCDGGATLVNELLKIKAVDEFIISVIPVVLGGGIALFKESKQPLSLQLIGTKSFDTGLVQLHYSCKY